jgi:hypothetical protein
VLYLQRIFSLFALFWNLTFIQNVDLVGVAFEGDMQKSLLLYCVVIALSFGPFAEAIDDPCELRIS